MLALTIDDYLQAFSPVGSGYRVATSWISPGYLLDINLASWIFLRVKTSWISPGYWNYLGYSGFCRASNKFQHASTKKICRVLKTFAQIDKICWFNKICQVEKIDTQELSSFYVDCEPCNFLTNIKIFLILRWTIDSVDNMTWMVHYLGK